MKLIFLYGPPAVGKLTVAQELAKLTSYRLFHNHLAQDLANELYPGFNKKKFDLSNAIRLAVLEYAAKNDTNLIFTYVYSGSQDDLRFVENVINLLSKYDSVAHFVQLTAPRSVLFDRVANDSRKSFKKIVLAEELEQRLNDYDIEGRIHVNHTLTIDTSSQKPRLSARQIVDYINK